MRDSLEDNFQDSSMHSSALSWEETGEESHYDDAFGEGFDVFDGIFLFFLGTIVLQVRMSLLVPAIIFVWRQRSPDVLKHLLDGRVGNA